MNSEVDVSAPYWIREFWLTGVSHGLAMMFLCLSGIRAYAAKRPFGWPQAIGLAAVIVAGTEAWRRVGFPTAGYVIVGALIGIAWALWRIRRAARPISASSDR